MRRIKAWLLLYAFLGLFVLYHQATGEPFLSLFFASPNQPPVWEPLDPERYVGEGKAFLEGVTAYNRQDFGAALRHWSPLAEDGHAEAQLIIGIIYDFGLGVEKDPDKAVEMYQLAANSNLPRAISILAYCYATGFGVQQDLPRAVQLNLKAATAGDRYAMYGIGHALYYGRGVKIDYPESKRWFLRAAELGHCKSHQMLALFYWEGIGNSEADAGRAYHHLLIAEKLGCPDDHLKFLTSWFVGLEQRLSIQQAVKEGLY